MKDKVIFITGSANGIGLGLAREFSSAGGRVVISDLDKEKVDDAVKILKKENLEVWGIPCDVLFESEIIAALDATFKRYGRIDVLINNAGLQYVAPVEDFPVEKFEQMIKVMLIAPFIAIKHVLPIMKKQKAGRIINIASINGLIGFANKAAYNSAKHGIIGLTKVVALEAAAYPITVNALCPGYANTSMVQNQLSALAKSRGISADMILDEMIFPLVPQKRLLEVEEISSYALFLAGDMAKGITGQAVVIDGGYTAQ